MRISQFTFITEDDAGTKENTGVFYRNNAGTLTVKLISAIWLNTGESCQPCSAERFAEYLNTIKGEP